MKKIILIPCLLALLVCLSSCGESDQSYFPLGNHAWWEYAIERSVMDKQMHQKYIIANLAARKIDDVLVYPRKLASGANEFYRRTEWGVVLTGSNGDEKTLILPLPVNKGAEWREKSRITFVDFHSINRPDVWSTIKPVEMTYRVQEVNETVRVPAGIFKNCVRVEAAGLIEVEENIKLFVGVRHVKVTQTDWYAPGVGLVKRIRDEITSPALLHGKYVQQLKRFKNN